MPDWGGQDYSSTRLITRGKADWLYGFFEVRAKLPCGKGTGPRSGSSAPAAMAR